MCMALLKFAWIGDYADVEFFTTLNTPLLLLNIILYIFYTERSEMFFILKKKKRKI